MNSDTGVVRPIDASVYEAFLEKHGEDLFARAVTFDYGALLRPSAKRTLEILESAHRGGPRFTFGAFEDDRLVGVHLARQQERGTLLMDVSGVLLAHRFRGHYGRLLAAAIALAKARGFQCVTSRHNAANNAVLIPKLKAGFLLSGFEVSDEQGLLVTLVLHLDPARRAAHAFRTGSVGVPESLRGAFRNLMPGGHDGLG